jgi:hypothetical protein
MLYAQKRKVFESGAISGRFCRTFKVLKMLKNSLETMCLSLDFIPVSSVKSLNLKSASRCPPLLFGVAF